METSSERVPQAVDSEDQIFFNLPKQGEGLVISQGPSNQQEEDRLSEASFLTVDNQRKAQELGTII